MRKRNKNKVLALFQRWIYMSFKGGTWRGEQCYEMGYYRENGTISIGVIGICKKKLDGTYDILKTFWTNEDGPLGGGQLYLERPFFITH